MAADMLYLEPKELVFSSVRFQEAQQQVVQVTNVLKAPVEGDIRAGSSDRYTVSPSSFRLRPGESVDITVTLKLDSKFAQRQRATESGQRDPFYIKTKFFDQRFNSTFYLHPEPDSKGSSAPGSNRPSRASSLSPQRTSPVGDAANHSSLQQQPVGSPRQARTGAAISRSSSFTIGAPAPGQQQRGRQSISREPGLQSPPSARQEQPPPAAVSRQSSSSTLPRFSVSQQQHQQDRLQDLQDISPSATGMPASAQPGSSRSWSAASAENSAGAALDDQPYSQQLSTLRRSSSSNGHSTSSSNNGRSVLRRTVSDDADVTRRQVQKSVSFADLPTWRTSAVDIAAESGEHHSQAWGPHSSRQTKPAVQKQPRRASDSELPMPRHGGDSSGSSSNEEEWELRVGHMPQRSKSAVVDSSAGDVSRMSFGDGLQSWRDSSSSARQHNAAAYSAEAGALPPGQQQEDYSSRLSSLAAATAEQGRRSAATLQQQQQQEEEEEQEQQAAHRNGSSSGSEQVPRGWAPQLTPVREESPGTTPEKPGAPATAAAANTQPYSTYTAPISGPATTELQPQQAGDREVAELRAALAAERSELAASHELLEDLAAEVPDAAKLFEAGAKQEQALQEERNRRALELLLQKDQVIQQLQERCQLAEDQLVQQQVTSAAAEGRARAAEALQQQLQAQLEQLEQQHMHQLADVRQAHAEQLQAMDDRLAAQTKQLLQAQQEVMQLSAELVKLSGQHTSAPGHQRATSHDHEVSLDQGIGANSPDRSPATATSNRRSQPAAAQRPAAEDAGHLLSLLAERDAELATLEAELAVARAALAGNADLPAGSGGSAAQVVLLQRDLAEALAALKAERERVADLEALQALAEAAAEEGELLAAREQCDAGAARREASRQQTEAEVARLTAARLNARVTELAAELSGVSARAEQLQNQLQTEQELHARENQAMLKKLAALIAAGGPHLADLAQEYDSITASPHTAGTQQHPLGLPSGDNVRRPNSTVAATDGSTIRNEALSIGAALTEVDTSREAYLSQAVEDAESTVALLQQRLVEATQQQQLAAARLQDMQDRAAAAAVRHTQQLAAAKQSGQVQLAALQDAVGRLANRSELAGQAAALHLQLSEVKRSEAKLSSEVNLLQQQLTQTQHELEEARSALKHQQHQQQQVAIHTMYPMMRAAKLLEAVHHLNLGSASASPQKNSRPWPSYEPTDRQTGLQAAADQHLLLKLPADMAAEEQAAAAAMASAWVAEMARSQELTASLLLRAQKAEMGLAAASLAADAKALQHSTGGADVASADNRCLTDISNTTAIVPAAKQPGRAVGSKAGNNLSNMAAVTEVQERLLELQQDLMLAQAELRAARQQRELADVEMSRLTAQLETSKAAAAAAAGQAGEAEQAAQQRLQAALSQKVQAGHRLSQELLDAQQRAAEAEASAKHATADKEAAHTANSTLKQQLAQLKADSARAVAEVVSVKSAAAAQAQDLRQQLAARDREIHRLSCEVDSHVLRAAVLLETIETLQAGGGGEQEQQLVGLTAQLAAAHGHAAAQEARIRELLDECESRAFAAAQLRQQLAAVQQEVAARSAALAAAEDAAAALSQQIEELRAQGRASGQQVARAGRDLSVLQQKLLAAEADVEGLRMALSEAQDRHAHQLQRERDAAAAAAQQSLLSQLAHDPPHAYVAHVAHVTIVLDDLLSAAQAAVNKHAGAAAIKAVTHGSRVKLSNSMQQLGWHSGVAGVGNDVSWVLGAMTKLKELLLGSDRLYVKSNIESQLSAQQASGLAAQLAAAQASVERLAGQWQAAEAAKGALMRAASRRAEQATIQVVERLHLQESRIESLYSHSQQICEQLTAAQVSATTANTAASSARRTANSLALQLEAALAETDSLRRTAAAATAEAAGNAEWATKQGTALTAGNSSAEAISEGVQQRDQGLMKWFEGRVATLLGGGHGAAQSDENQMMALARQLCGMKLVESQILASLAAANIRSDAAALRSQCLAAALEAANAKAAATPTARAEATGQANSSEDPQQEQLAVQVARLTAQAAARSQEVYRLQDQLLQAKQLLSSRDLELQELQSQLDDVSQASSAQQAADAAALAAQRAALTAAAAAEEARLRREVQELRQLLDKQSAASTAALSNERIEAARRVEDSAAAAVVAAQEAAASALHAAEVKVALLEGQVDVLEQERDMLQEKVYTLESEVADLQASSEVTNSAVQSLEATLAAIERAEARRASQGPPAAAAAARRSRTPPGRVSAPGGRQSAAAAQPGSTRPLAGSRHSSRDDTAAAEQQQEFVAARSGSSDENDVDAAVAGSGSAAVLSRELVKAQMAAADAHRKLRVSARSEVELRQRLADRDSRLSQLKQQLTDKKHESEMLQRRVTELLGGTSRHSAVGTPTGAAYGFSRQPSATARTLSRSSSSSRASVTPKSMRSELIAGNPAALAAAAADSVDRGSEQQQQQQLEQQQQEAEGDQQVAFASAHGLAAAEKEYLAHQIAALRISLAKRDAEVARLEGALAEAVAQQKEPSPRPSAAAAAAAAAPAGPLLSRLGSRSVSSIPAGNSAHNSPREQSPLGRPRAVTEASLQPGGFSSMRPPSLSVQPQQLDSSRGHLGTLGSRGLDSSRGLRSSHSATAAARVARQANSRSAAEQTAGADDGDSPWQQQQQQQCELAAQLAAANAELASALATARQVLADLVLGSEPEPAAAAQVQAELAGFGLDEALSEIVHQVQDKLTQAAAAAESAIAEATAPTAITPEAAAARLPSQSGRVSRASSMQHRAATPRGSELLSAPGSESAAVSLAAERDALLVQVHSLASQLEATAAEKEAMATRLDRAASAREELAKQLATFVSERDSLAQQNTALASALSGRLTADDIKLVTPLQSDSGAVASAAAAGSAGPGHGSSSAGAEGDASRSSSPGGPPTPAQLKKIGQLMEKLTKENAGLIKARDAALSDKAALFEELSASQEDAASLQRSLEAAERQLTQLSAVRDQLEADAAALQQRVEELAATQENLQAQVAGARAERDMLAKENATLAATTNQLMAGRAALADEPGLVTAREGSQGIVFDSDGPNSTAGGSFRTRTISAPPRTGGITRLSSAPAATIAAAAVAADAHGDSTPKITSGQLREIGQMLARLTRENAALIKQRDKAEAALAPAVSEAQKANAAADAAVRELQQAVEFRDRLKSEADAARAEAQRSVAAIKQLTAEKERLQQQVSSLTAERDSMAAQNIALASTTSKLMASPAGHSTQSGSSPFAAADGPGTMDATAAVEALNASIGAAMSLASQSGAQPSPRTSATRLSEVSDAQPPPPQQQHGARAGGVLSPAQAREIGALLSRLTSENAMFLKEKDAAVVARDEAQNRVTALQAEVEMLQQQFRDLELEVQQTDAHRQQQQKEYDIPSPAHSSASVSGVVSARPSGDFGLPGQQQQQQQMAGRQSRASTPDASRALQLCRSIQRSVSCAESVHQAMTAASTPRASTAATTPTAAAAAAVSPTVQPEGLTQVLGAELAVLKEAAEALGDQLQQITEQQQQQGYLTAATAAAGPRQASQDRLDFSFSLPRLEIPRETADLTGFPSSHSSQHHQQQQQMGLNSSRGPSPPASARPSLHQQQQQQSPGSQPGSARPSADMRQQSPADANTAVYTVQVSVAVLNQLQEAAEQHKKHCGKWKSKCKQLAQHVGVLNAQLQQAQLQAGQREYATAQDKPEQQHQQQQQAATLDEMCSAVAAGQREVRSLREQLTAATQATSLDSHQVHALLQRLESTESSAMQRLSSSISAAAALLNKGEELAGSAAAAAGAVEGQVASLLTAAAGVEARVMGLERTFAAISQAQLHTADDHEAAVAGATQLQSQLLSLQQQLQDTTAQFAEEQQRLDAALAAAIQGQKASEAAAEEARGQLSVARDVLADRLGEAERQHKAQLAELRRRHQTEVNQLKHAITEAKNMSEAAAAAAVAQRLAAAESGRAAAEAALSQMAEDIRGYQAAKADEMQQLEEQIEALMLAAPAAVAAEFADTAELPATAGRIEASSRARLARGNIHTSSSSAIRRRGGAAGAAALHHGRSSATARVLHRPGGVRLGGKAAATAGRGAKHKGAHQNARGRDNGSDDLSDLLHQLRQGLLGQGAGYNSSATPAPQQQPQQQPGDVHTVAEAVMASVRAADSLAAAEREANFQRLARHRAEAAADAVRTALTRLKARLRAVKADADNLRKAAAAGAVAAVESAGAKEEAARALAELAAAKEALRGAKAENQRRQRQQAAAVAAATAAAGGAGSSGSVDLLAVLAAAVGGDGGETAGGGGDGRLTGVVMVLQREVAAAAASREAAEQKLKEAKATIDRKNLLIRELKSRVEDMSSRLAANPTAALEERAAAAEGRAKQLAASLARKEVSLREAKQALEETKSKLDECHRAAGVVGGSGELERQAKMIQRLRAEVGRKEQALQAVTNDLDACKEQLAAGTAAVDTANKKHAAAEAAARRATAKQQQRLAAAGHAVTAVASLLLACLAAMAAAAAALQQHAHDTAAAAAAEEASRQQTPNDNVRASTDSTASAAAAAMVASGLADMVCLSQEELTDLLGAEDETCRLLGLTSTARTSTDTRQSEQSNSKKVLLLESGASVVNEQHRHLQQQLYAAVEQLVNGEGVASSSSTSRHDSDGAAVQTGQQQHGVLKGLLLQSVLNELSDVSSLRQEELRAVVAATVCA